MPQELEKAIEAVFEELNKIELKAIELKKSIDTLSSLAGKRHHFSDVESSLVIGKAEIRRDQFYGKGLATAVKVYIKMRGRALASQEIIEALKVSGFDFPGKWSEKFMLRNLAILLSKNRNDFVYLKHSNSFVLLEFYPDK